MFELALLVIVVGSFFLPSNLTADTYLNLLRDLIEPELTDIIENDENHRMVFLHILQFLFVSIWFKVFWVVGLCQLIQWYFYFFRIVKSKQII